MLHLLLMHSEEPWPPLDFSLLVKERLVLFPSVYWRFAGEHFWLWLWRHCQFWSNKSSRSVDNHFDIVLCLPVEGLLQKPTKNTRTVALALMVEYLMGRSRTINHLSVYRRPRFAMVSFYNVVVIVKASGLSYGKQKTMNWHVGKIQGA